MKETFNQEFPSFKERINDFIISTHFHSRLKEYEETLKTISSLAATDINENNELHTELLDTIDTSFKLMKEIVSLNQGLDTIFKMDKEALGLFCNYDFTQIDKRVTQDLNNSASLIQKFDDVSQKGREIFESLNNPFTSQST